MNKTKIVITSLLACLAMVFVPACSTFTGGSNSGTGTVVVADQGIVSTVSFATNAALRYTVRDAASRTVVANYINVYAASLRSITGSPTPDQLTAEINKWIPASVKANYPFVVDIGISLISNEYVKYYNQLSGNPAKIAAILNSIAYGLEQGSAEFTTPATGATMHRTMMHHHRS